MESMAPSYVAQNETRNTNSNIYLELMSHYEFIDIRFITISSFTNFFKKNDKKRGNISFMLLYSMLINFILYLMLVQFITWRQA